MKKYNLITEKKDHYSFFTSDEKYLKVLEDVKEKKYKVLQEFKNDNRTYVALIEIEEYKYILKIPKKEYKDLFKRIITFFKKGEALTTLINSIKARNLGLSELAEVYGVAVKRKKRIIIDSFFLMEHVEGEFSLERDKIHQIFEITQKMHKLGMYHGDCNPYNFLFIENNEIRIVDTKARKMRFCNYKAHYDLITLSQYYKDMTYPYKKNIFYYLAYAVKKRWKIN